MSAGNFAPGPGATVGGMRIAPMTPAHAGQVLAIYQAGIDGGDATFETTAPSWAQFDAARLPEHRWVALAGQPGEEVLGWIAVKAVSERAVYAGVVEHSVFVAARARRTGVGRALLTALVTSTEAGGIWTVQSGVFPENLASLALHAELGFRQVGRRERLGRHLGTWRDVVLIERRSRVAGIGP
jgi:L-amino acid N-acyltransferase YncA